MMVKDCPSHIGKCQKLLVTSMLLTKKSFLNQQAHLFMRMAPPKNMQNLGRGSFGGHNQRQPEILRSRHEADTASVGSIMPASVNLSLNDDEFPQLGHQGAGPSTISSMGRTGKGTVQSSFSRGQTEAYSYTSSKPFVNARGSRHNHNTGRRQPACGESGSPSNDRIYYLSRLLSSILRHRAIESGLNVRNDGYVIVHDILKLGITTMRGIPLSAYTADDVLLAVERDNKQRFGVLTENGVLMIRANQGHSIKTIKSDKLLKRVLSADEVPVCVHGTLMRNLDSILKTGLKKMGRNHVHFATGLPKEDGVISGMRFSSEVLVYLDAKKALQDGMKLFLSENGVILTDGFDGVVLPEYFAQVAKWSKGKIIPLSLDT